MIQKTTIKYQFTQKYTKIEYLKVQTFRYSRSIKVLVNRIIYTTKNHPSFYVATTCLQKKDDS